MKIIPPTTTPPDAPFSRDHAPKVADWKGGYGEYRRCLRWDFGFTCAFCLLHESDLNEFGLAEGWAVTSIEHRQTQKSASGEANSYANCYYACRFCNGSRATKPLMDPAGNEVLDPCRDNWSANFAAYDHCLEPRTPRGEYTQAVYDINDATRVHIRKTRLENIHRWRRLILEGPKEVTKLMTIAQDLLRSPKFHKRSEGEFLMQQAQKRQEDIAHARNAIERYLAIPKDRDTKCRCTGVAFKLPVELEKQLIDISV